ncbi:hypothetical protein, partial [Escherichia coli]|uniref:hypothetical protein n=1 Tax=Escherichia coli TaxID=562 RepID=UPI001BC83CEA
MKRRMWRTRRKRVRWSEAADGYKRKQNSPRRPRKITISNAQKPNTGESSVSSRCGWSKRQIINSI